MADLDTLRPEVQEAMHRLENYLHITIDGKHFRSEDYDTIRAELLRLANENADYGKHAIEQYKRGVYWMDRAKEAEAELAALKARIAEAPSVVLSYAGGHWHDAPYAVMAQARVPDDSWCNKRVRLIVEE